MKIQINLPTSGTPIVETIINSPIGIKKREIELLLPLGFERCRYKVCFLDMNNNHMIGPYSNREVVDFSCFSGRIKVRAVLDKEYKISFSDTITTAINTYGEYSSYMITYSYSGLIDIDIYNLAYSTCSFSSEQSLIMRAQLIMEQVLRTVIGITLSQNQVSGGGISSNVFYNLEFIIAASIKKTFDEACKKYLIWCYPVGCLKIHNTNIQQVIDMLNTPIQIERMRDQETFKSNIRLKEICAQSILELKKEQIASLSNMMTAAVNSQYELEQMKELPNIWNAYGNTNKDIDHLMDYYLGNGDKK